MRLPRSSRAVLLAVAFATPSHAAHPDVLSPLVVRPIATPDPVLGADGRVHLAYELLLVNLSPSPLTIDSVEALDPVLDGKVVETLRGRALGDVLRLSAGEKGTTLGPGGTATLFMDV